MRMFLLFILLFIPIPTLANTPLTTCSEHNQYPESCNSTAGCQYKANFNYCGQCAPGSYCPGDGTTPECPEHFTNSELGATSPEECFAEIETNNGKCYWVDANENPYNYCGRFYPDNAPKCWDDDTSSYDTSFHNEGDKCYYNNRSCNAFTPSGCDTPSEIVGNAFWETDHWELSACKCVQTSVNYEDAHCIAHMEKTPNPSTQQSANATVSYSNVSWYYCTGCPAGGYVNPDTDFQTNSKCFASDSSILVVCQCTNVERGYYGAGVNNIEYPISNTSAYSQSPYRNACPAGKTTNGPGATSANACEYTNQTKFCDAKGCFTLGGDFDNWDFN